MENDLISRSALLEKSELIIDANYDDYIVVDEEDIKNAPAVDAVEVVRCEKCVHFDTIDGTPYCHYWSRNTEESGFCHHGL